MATIASFTYNDFQENTYIIYDDTKECVIIDPGCYMRNEKLDLTDFIVHNGLTPKMLLQTHCHIDHILGTGYVAGKFSLQPKIHEKEIPVLAVQHDIADMYGYVLDNIPETSNDLVENEVIKFGNTELKILFTPGHSPGSVTFYCEEDNFAIAGDVLFLRSIGRTDLPGGNFETLMESIKNKLLVLADDVKVYPGHGPMTTIGFEREHNPFLVEHM